MESHTHRLAVILLATTLMSSCATSMFSITSSPSQAEVYLESPKGEKKSLGKTPIEMPMSVMKDNFGKDSMEGDYFTVHVEKQGFISQRLAIPTTRFGTYVTAINAKLKAGDQGKETQLAKDILDHLYLAQKFALTHEYERAHVEVDRVLTISPNFARAFSMRASIYFVQKNIPESIKWYEAALKADPQMDEAVKMLAKVHAQQIGDAPTASTPPAQGSKP